MSAISILTAGLTIFSGTVFISAIRYGFRFSRFDRSNFWCTDCYDCGYYIPGAISCLSMILGKKGPTKDDTKSRMYNGVNSPSTVGIALDSINSLMGFTSMDRSSGGSNFSIAGGDFKGFGRRARERNRVHGQGSPSLGSGQSFLRQGDPGQCIPTQSSGQGLAQGGAEEDTDDEQEGRQEIEKPVDINDDDDDTKVPVKVNVFEDDDSDDINVGDEWSDSDDG